MRILAVGDIHGCLSALRSLAAAVPFEAYDVIVTLGDYVDRGPDSRGVVEWLLAWQRDHRLIALKGNHELLMLQGLQDRFALRRWLEVGGTATMESYQRAAAGGELVPQAHREFLAQTLPWWETDSHIFVHASVDPALPMEKQTDVSLLWTPVDFTTTPHVSGKQVICGHSAHRDGFPKSNGHLTCIDTWAYGGGWLTGLDVGSGVYWQARETGEVRSGMIGS